MSQKKNRTYVFKKFFFSDKDSSICLKNRKFWMIDFFSEFFIFLLSRGEWINILQDNFFEKKIRIDMFVSVFSFIVVHHILFFLFYLIFIEKPVLFLFVSFAHIFFNTQLHANAILLWSMYFRANNLNKKRNDINTYEKFLFIISS